MSAYIPTAAERGAAYRERLGFATIEQARTSEHRMPGSFIPNVCDVCGLPQEAGVHGAIHLVRGAPGAAEYACAPLGPVQAPLTNRTRRVERVTCHWCVVILIAEEVTR